MSIWQQPIARSLMIVCSISVILFSCNDEPDNKVPAEIIQPDTMADIMVSMHIAESTIMLNRVNDRQDARNAVFIKEVLKSHGTDTARYRKSFDYYTAHPERFEEIYETVISRLTQMQAGEDLQNKRDSV